MANFIRRYILKGGLAALLMGYTLGCGYDNPPLQLIRNGEVSGYKTNVIARRDPKENSWSYQVALYGDGSGLTPKQINCNDFVSGNEHKRFININGDLYEILCNEDGGKPKKSNQSQYRCAIAPSTSSRIAGGVSTPWKDIESSEQDKVKDANNLVTLAIKDLIRY